MLDLRNITKTYPAADGPVHALDNVSIHVEPGSFTAVCGPSGCGKTTLLLTAGALLAPTAGEVVIDGRDVYALSPEQRAAFRASHIGFVFQQFHLISYLSVRDNIMAAALATDDPEAGQRADALIEELGLTDRAAHRPGELSTGQRQRTAMARALLNRPKLLLADEPTGNLDRDNAAIVLDHLAAFAAAGGAVLLVTHDPTAARRAHQFVHLDTGRLVPAEPTAAGA